VDVTDVGHLDRGISSGRLSGGVGRLRREGDCIWMNRGPRAKAEKGVTETLCRISGRRDGPKIVGENWTLCSYDSRTEIGILDLCTVREMPTNTGFEDVLSMHHKPQ
jgi:hypothetical protein